MLFYVQDDMATVCDALIKNCSYKNINITVRPTN